MKSEKIKFRRLILASASPRRRRLMRSFPWPVRVRPSRVEEPKHGGRIHPRDFVVRLSKLKAREVARRIPGALVLGADTIVYLKGKVYGKPTSVGDAARILGALAGRWHRVYTGLTLVASPEMREWSVAWMTRVKMRTFTPPELDFWSRRNHDKAGAYAVQSKRGGFVTGLRGDYDNVVGLPRRGVRQLLAKARRAGFRPL